MAEKKSIEEIKKGIEVSKNKLDELYGELDVAQSNVSRAIKIICHSDINYIFDPLEVYYEARVKADEVKDDIESWKRILESDEKKLAEAEAEEYDVF